MEAQSLHGHLLNSNDNSSQSSPTINPCGERTSIPVTGKIFLVILIIFITSLSITTLISINSYLTAFHAPILEVDSVTVYPFNISSSSSSHRIAANWTISISIANPEYGASYYYEDMEASVWLKNEEICSKLIGDLLLDGVSMKMMRKTVRIENLAAEWVDLTKSTVDAVKLEWRRDGAVTFSLKMNGSGRKGPEVDHNKRKKIVASCDNLRVGFIYNTGVATLITPSVMCYAHLYD